ncbi:MAG: YgiT-type zinc finger protein, partial [Thermoplasmata archaeon]
MAQCPVCGKGKLRRGKVREQMFGVDLGEYPAEICDSCGESFVDQKAMKKIETR